MTDTATNRAVKTNAVTGVWKKETTSENTFEGVMYIGYNLIDVEIQYANKYFEFLDIPFMSMVSVGTIIVSLLLYHSSGQKNFWMSLLFLSILNIYITTFINTREGVTTLDVENNKVKDINDGILSISFLAAVNIYILQTLKEIKDHRNLHNESAFLFTLALVLLLFSLYKKSNYNKIDDIRTHRIEKQLMYNMSIFVNLFILFNYLVYVARDGRILSDIGAYLKHTL
jgi:acyl-CoA synthetase (AMP-forming)/AMP-acid ligase II